MLSALWALAGCGGEGAGADESGEAGPTDAMALDAMSMDGVDLDIMRPDAALRDALIADADQDADVLDAMIPDDAAVVVFEPVTLLTEAAEPVEGGWRWQVPASAVPERASFQVLALTGGHWRLEAAEMTLTVGEQTATGQALAWWGPGEAVWSAPWSQIEGDEAGRRTEPSPMVFQWPSGDEPIPLTVSTTDRSLTGLRLVPVGTPSQRVDPPELEAPEVEAPAPCGGTPGAPEGCDDGVALTEALRQAVEQAGGPVRFALRPGRYVLRTPWRISETAVIVGGPEVELVHDPAEPAPEGALLVQGARPGPAVAVRGAVAEGATRLPIEGPLDPEARWFQVTADDHGEVPALCVDGRDVEREMRHITHLSRGRVEEGADGPFVVLERPLGLALPAEANPRVAPVALLENPRLVDVRLTAHCPIALVDEPFTSDQCANPHVVGDSGVVFRWTSGAQAEGLTVAGFGKYAVALYTTLDTTIRDSRLDRPAAFGEGGQGYGVHAIGATATRVIGLQVTRARHAVVVDFGSSETVIAESQISGNSLAALDVHGEASRDTLILGNHIEDSGTGVVVGGGGLAVHCNDGPRHHVLGNAIIGATLYGLQVTDHTRSVTLRGNAVSDSPVGVFVTNGAGEVALTGNRFEAIPGPNVLISGAQWGTGPVEIQRNRFDDCPVDRVIRAEEGVEISVGAGQGCP